MRIEVNGEPREVGEKIKLVDLIRELALAPERVAIELNQEVVRRSDWAGTAIAEGDRVEIVHFVGGGSGEARRAKGEEQRAKSKGRRAKGEEQRAKSKGLRAKS